MTGTQPEQLIPLLHASAIAAWRSSFSGQSQWLRDRLEWFRNPQPGELVVETTTAFNSPINSIGYLISANFEPCFSDEEWEKVKDEYGNKRPTEKIWRIRLLIDGTECKWENANFVRVPVDLRDFSTIGSPTEATDEAR